MTTIDVRREFLYWLVGRGLTPQQAQGLIGGFDVAKVSTDETLRSAEGGSALEAAAWDRIIETTVAAVEHATRVAIDADQLTSELERAGYFSAEVRELIRGITTPSADA